ncbi:MAG: VWA domain-containing protein [Anaerolineaceae bacterium]|nr:MAG: VWA domain-containing protein [Anaerolineaceae bacterium]
MFSYPFALILLLTLPPIALFIIWRAGARDRRMARLGDPAIISQLADSVSPRRRRIKHILKLIVLALLIIALAQPTWGIAEEVVTAEGVAVMVVLDVSRSMKAEDVSPNRLERAKLTARTLFEDNEGNLVGLVLFAADAIVQFPLTTDSRSALTFLDAASTRAITRQGTAIRGALLLAMETLDERVAGRSVIVLLSDGEDHEGGVLSAAQMAAERDIVIHAVGYGTLSGTTIPELSADGQATIGARTDRAGNVITTRLEEDLLLQIAETTGGIYRRAGESGIENIDLANAINEIEAQELENRLQIRRVERFALFIFFGLMLMTVETMIPERRP